ncbi:MAG TPA: undecaprenyldiphospho-muramoylpentapeptide beta-N-acetylglucosaminyltransferase [Thermoclostridium sp.]|nr:undecaprenyldiphospho-muramoylpentapeptide beta-N-acetylglucosaminyltransferase [Clostridiaceae bacterium]HOQ75442.1 undecaprenyldiphospho-muramoylpentapeptide beta-N-acetylglucosaminyltransferase [Thermoclostridium sp.]HPU45341.1 undecaprenyldiphospho-muramoylpentapeptide beta-N-acetylglucosaminyltransferase [Thermoclostridium sp.]
MKKIVMTGGGTSGHVTPNIALIPVLKEMGCHIEYIGSKDGMEKQLIEAEGIPYHGISAGKLRRYMSLKNLSDMFRVMGGLRQSVSLIRNIRPDIVFSKGGFVSCPVVWAAWLCRVPVVIHESDITPGLTNKLSMPFARKVCYTFPESGEHIPKEKGVLTGLPIRKALLEGNRAMGRMICGFEDDKPVLLVMGGSQGAVRINEALRKSLGRLVKDFNICHICGKGNVDEQYQNVRGYRQFEYLRDELPDIFALADIVVSRAGATSIFELLALRKPNLLIPLSRQASRGDQILNAESFRRQGFSMVLADEELSPDTLYDSVKTLYESRQEYKKAMAGYGRADGTHEVVRVLQEILQHQEHT